MSVLQNATKTDKGVMVNGFVVSPIVDKCEGCGHVCEFEGEKFCSSYPTPPASGAAAAATSPPTSRLKPLLPRRSTL